MSKAALKTKRPARGRRPIGVPAVPSLPAGERGPAADVTVLMGGPSAEREVSLLSGRAISDALRRLGHRVTESDISPRDASALEGRAIDAVFIALHGEFGESGEVQDLCEARGLAYTGSGPLASRTAMDKVAAKRLFQGEGLSTPAWAVLEAADGPARQAELLAGVPGPIVLKPIDGGSSVDVIIARDEATRDRAVGELLSKYGRILVERFIGGRELTVGVLGDRTLPALEIIPSREFYDYTAKYADGSGTRYRFDLGLPADVASRIEADAWTAFRSIGCRDMGRVDFILDSEGVPWLLEVNTIPGFTSHSLLPMAAGKAGVPFDQLVGRLLELALERSRAGRRAEE